MKFNRPQKDRNRVQVPDSLPEWLDGPRIRARAKEWGTSYEKARARIRKKARARIRRRAHGEVQRD